MKAEDLVRAALAATLTGEVMDVLTAIAKLDRYQASIGIETAARKVRDVAFDWGLRDVEIRNFPADGKARWWDWQAPKSWTPLVARLSVGAGGDCIEIDHSKDPFSIAAYSHPTPAEGLRLPIKAEGGDCDDCAGCLLLLNSDVPIGTERIAALERSGIAGFVTDYPARVVEGYAASGRIELPLDNKLFAFSTIPSVMLKLRERAAMGAFAQALVSIDRNASMPVVTGTIPGRTGEEAWLIAHLCHPRPSANDNASGVAALLGAIRVLASLGKTAPPPDLTLRFVWGPEFLGTVGLLHEAAQQGFPGPKAVINVDMVGEDQLAGGGPFVLERHPQFIASPLNLVAEGIIGELFRQTSDGCSSWKASPFQGFSDHALFAAPPFQAPAIQLTHDGDPFNHSAADDIDKVSSVEMHRAIAACAATAFLVARTGLFQEFASNSAPKHRADSIAEVHSDRDPSNAPSTPAQGFIPLRTWDGPLNLRALLSLLEPDLRTKVHRLLEMDRTNHAWLYNVASRVDGRRSFGNILEDVSTEFGAQLNAQAASAFYEMMLFLSAHSMGPAPGGAIPSQTAT